MRVCLFVSACCMALATTARAGDFKTLHDFTGGQDGAAPEAPVIAGPDGTLYGTTSAGGGGPCINPLDIPGCGTVFSLTPPAQGKKAWHEAIIYRFVNQADGASPYAGLVQDAAGNLYGTTYDGGDGTGPDCGVDGCGTVFQLSPPAQGQTNWSKTTLYSLQEAVSGALPRARLVLDANGALLGTASLGGPGATYPGGTVFRLVPPKSGKGAWKVTTLYVFKGGRDGSAPFTALLPAPNGNYFGTTYTGGGDYVDCEDSGCGTAYQITPSANGHGKWREHILHRFSHSTDGAYPMGDLVADASGHLFGTSSSGGGAPFNGGTAWRLAPPANGGSHWTRTILHAFGFSKDGDIPESGVILGSKGVLFGTTLQGGSKNSNGTLFSLKPPAGNGAWHEHLLYDFPNPKPDSEPSASLLLGAGGVLYGTTAGNGGPTGTVFSLTLKGAD